MRACNKNERFPLARLNQPRKLFLFFLASALIVSSIRCVSFSGLVGFVFSRDACVASSQPRKFIYPRGKNFVDNPHKALSLSPTLTHTQTRREKQKKRNDDWSNNGIDVFLVARVLLFLFFLVFSELDDEPSRHREETMCDVIVFPTVRLQKLLQERSTTERRRRSGIFARRVRQVEQRVVF